MSRLTRIPSALSDDPSYTLAPINPAAPTAIPLSTCSLPLPFSIDGLSSPAIVSLCLPDDECAEEPTIATEGSTKVETGATDEIEAGCELVSGRVGSIGVAIVDPSLPVDSATGSGSCVCSKIRGNSILVCNSTARFTHLGSSGLTSRRSRCVVP